MSEIYREEKARLLHRNFPPPINPNRPPAIIQPLKHRKLPRFNPQRLSIFYIGLIIVLRQLILRPHTQNISVYIPTKSHSFASIPRSLLLSPCLQMGKKWVKRKRWERKLTLINHSLSLVQFSTNRKQPGCSGSWNTSNAAHSGSATTASKVTWRLMPWKVLEGCVWVDILFEKKWETV